MYTIPYWPVRQAFRSDWPAIKEFFKNLDKESRRRYFNGTVSDASIDQLWTMFDQRDSDTFFLVEYCDRIVGVCQVANNNGHAELAVAVNKEYQHRGIGTSLVDRAMTWCKTHNVVDVATYSALDNTVVQKIIANHGFTPTMLSTPAEAKFVVSEPDAVDVQKEISGWVVSWYLTWLKHTMFKLFAR
jgi:RimJ/RimL family protein N-acetyltransferase